MCWAHLRALSSAHAACPPSTLGGAGRNACLTLHLCRSRKTPTRSLPAAVGRHSQPRHLQRTTELVACPGTTHDTDTQAQQRTQSTQPQARYARSPHNTARQWPCSPALLDGLEERRGQDLGRLAAVVLVVLAVAVALVLAFDQRRHACTHARSEGARASGQRARVPEATTAARPVQHLPARATCDTLRSAATLAARKPRQTRT